MSTPSPRPRAALRRRLAAALLAATLAAAVPCAALPLGDDAPEAAPQHGAVSNVTRNAPPKPAPAPAPAHVATPPAATGDYAFVGFDRLAAFPFDAPEVDASVKPGAEPTAAVLQQIPAAIRELDGRLVTVTGFMLPTKIEQGLTTEFLLLNSPLMCCFGVTPPTNAWIVVRMPKGVPPRQDTPLSFRGRLHVHAQWDGGWLTSVYQLDGDTAAP